MKFFRIVLLGLILVLVAMASALTAMRMAIHGREVTVPDLRGLGQSQAASVANDAGLVIEVEERFYSRDVKPGHILSQQPAPGAVVRKGSRIRLAASLGPQQAEVPDLVGQSSRAAQINLQRRGMEVGSIAELALPEFQAGVVLAQNPPAKSPDAASSKVTLLVAAPHPAREFLMPSFVGSPVAAAVAEAEKAGFTVGRISQLQLPPGQPPQLRPGIVVRQWPAAGERISAGGSISLEASSESKAANQPPRK